MKIIAHRGYSSKYPENTKSAFKAALDYGVDGIEFDVHLTKDKKVVVIHDETINRTSNGLGYIKNYKLNELKEYDFGSHFDQKYKGEKILTLEETLEIIKDVPIINIEIKNIGRYYKNLEKIVISILKDFDLINKTIISSFNHQSLFLIRKYNKEIKLAPLFYARIHNGFDYLKKLNSNYIHVYYKMINNDFVKMCHKNNISINTYTVDNKFDIEKMYKAQVDGIITNYPERVKEINN